MVVDGGATPSIRFVGGEEGIVPAEGRWRGAGRVSLQPGDVVYVEPIKGAAGSYALRQVPEINGGMVVLDPHSGRVLALVGGFSYYSSAFNRATQACRQPGSSFKPFVYAAALDEGYTPSSLVLDGRSRCRAAAAGPGGPRTPTDDSSASPRCGSASRRAAT